jgi:alcohol dehydrogenase (cytochrome c)
MNSTLAINPDTGKLVWYYQHIGADPYDMDYAFERIVAPVNIGGKRVKAVITVGKPGIFEGMDAATGKFLFAVDPGAQNVATAIDPVTGVKTLLPEPPPPGVTRCPGNIGARSFPAGTYSPSTNKYYLPIMDSCMGKMGDTPARFLALDLNTLKFAWDIRTRVPQSSGALSTAGGAGVFGNAGSLFPRFRRPRRQGAVGESTAERHSERFSHHLHGGRQAVHRHAGREPRAAGQQRVVRRA